MKHRGHDRTAFASVRSVVRVAGMLFISVLMRAQELPLPPRPANALGAAALKALLGPLSREDRENEIFDQFLSGNVPEFYRHLTKVTFTASAGGVGHTVSVWVTPEYAALGHDTDYVLMPMGAILAQKLANSLECILPTRVLVDKIYVAAGLKLRPQPIPPTAEMITIPVFYQHKDSVDSIRKPQLASYPLGTLVGGHKKNVIISRRIYENLKPSTPKPVVIYGWHYLSGSPIQPVYNGHVEWYADYSHGIRFVRNKVLVDSDTLHAYVILNDATLSSLLSDEGTIPMPYYVVPTSVPEPEPRPEGYRLEQNIPNPFNPSTRIPFFLPRQSHIRVAVYDMVGRQVALLKEGLEDPGEHVATWHSTASSGVYVCTLDAVSTGIDRSVFRESKRMVLVR